MVELLDTSIPFYPRTEVTISAAEVHVWSSSIVTHMLTVHGLRMVVEQKGEGPYRVRLHYRCRIPITGLDVWKFLC